MIFYCFKGKPKEPKPKPKPKRIVDLQKIKATILLEDGRTFEKNFCGYWEKGLPEYLSDDWSYYPVDARSRYHAWLSGCKSAGFYDVSNNLDVTAHNIKEIAVEIIEYLVEEP
jgi:hypothetical protein